MSHSSSPSVVCPSRLQVAAAPTRYVSCTVDPRPGRAVHCPDLNACLVNEGRNTRVDCQAVHFGYAIPVTVVPLAEQPHLAELVLDAAAVTPEAAGYLLERHPDLRSMADPIDDDIAAIAKQISDHAEAIYQTWKSQGLAPTEILNCAPSVDRFRPALSPQRQPPAVNLLSSNANLKKLVDNFVEEDKARMAAERQQRAATSKNLPSSIQYALQKFENKSNVSPGPYIKPSSPVITQEPTNTKPHHISPAKPSTMSHHIRTSPVPSSSSPTLKTTSSSGMMSPSPPNRAASVVKQSTPGKMPTFHHGIELETAETSFPQEIAPTKAQAVDVVDNSSPGLTTWPLKNKAVGNFTGGKVINTITPTSNSVAPESKFSTMPTNKVNCIEQNYTNQHMQDQKYRTMPTNSVKTVEQIYSSVPSSKVTPTDMKYSSTPSTVVGNQKSPIKNNTFDQKYSTLPSNKASSMDQKYSAMPSNKTNSLDHSFSSSVSNKIDSKYSSMSNKNLSETQVSSVSSNKHQSTTGTKKGGVLEISSKKNSNAYLDEVAREEERLINALKTGIIIAPEKKTPSPLLKKAAGAPHPELTTQQRQHIRQTAGANPVRPFLTRGSVAERVLIFEKCPTEVLLDTKRSWRPAQAVAREKDVARTKALPPNTTLQRHVKANRNVNIPSFYFPLGKPGNCNVDTTLQNINACFQQFNNKVPRDKFAAVATACDVPLYWKIPLFIAAGGEETGYVELKKFMEFWKRMLSLCHDMAARFTYILTKGKMRNLLPDDFVSLVQDVVDTHPGLTFLNEAADFHSRYVHTVITRIYYCVNRSWTGHITLPELRRSNLLDVIKLLQEEDDINQITSYFSYEHFYVIYCKFWELDNDHDLFIDKQDLARYGDCGLSSRIIDRIFSGAVTYGGKPQERMSYGEFIWFLLSEEDKMHPTAIEYWFRCMDIDGDGFISIYELEYFYSEQYQRLDTMGIEALPFEDCLCQMLDMINPKIPEKISLSDLKRCKMTTIFFDTFFNLEKYLDHEQKDPFASQRNHDLDGHEMSDWDRFAAEEYEILVAEEGRNEMQEDLSGEGSSEDLLSPNLDIMTNTQEHIGYFNNSYDSDESENADSDCSV